MHAAGGLNTNHDTALRGFRPAAPLLVRRSDGKSLKLRYEHPDGDDDPQDDPAAAADMALTARVATVLETHYRGHFWKVEVSHKQGVVCIGIPVLMNNHCYVLHISNLDPGLRRVVRAAGELLERYRIPRSRISIDDMMTAIQRHPLGYRYGAPAS